MIETLDQPIIEQEEVVGRPTIAFLAPRGTFTEYAASQARQTEDTELVRAKSIREVCEAVAYGYVDTGVIPLENSVGGDVKDSVLALYTMGLRIKSESILAISHTLYYQERDLIEELDSKDQALYQCGNYAKKHFPQATQVKVDSTTEGVKNAAKNSRIAGIGSKNAIEGLLADEEITQEEASRLKRVDGIEDSKYNATTFVEVEPITSPDMSEPTGNDKTTLIVNLSDKAGSLHKFLKHLQEQGINLNKIRSIGTTDGTVPFLVSIDGHQKEPHIREVLEELQKDSQVKLLGSYPKADYIPPTVNGDAQIAPETVKQVQAEMNGSQKGKAVVVFTLKDEPGTLCTALEAYAKRGINLTGINSLPVRRTIGEYAFYLAYDRNAKGAEEAYKELTTHCKKIVKVGPDLTDVLPPLGELMNIKRDGGVIFDAFLQTAHPEDWGKLSEKAQSWLTRGGRVAIDSLGNKTINVPK